MRDKLVQELIDKFAINGADIVKVERLLGMDCPDELIRPIMNSGIDLKLMQAGKVELLQELKLGTT